MIITDSETTSRQYNQVIITTYCKLALSYEYANSFN